MNGSSDLFAAIDQHRVPIEPLLKRLLDNCAGDAGFAEDLNYSGFQPCPMSSDEIDCNNPWFFVIAMNGCGSAYGLYLHPDAMRDGLAPWAFWDHEDDVIFVLANDTEQFLRGLFTLVSDLRIDHERVVRIGAGLATIGVATDVGSVTLPFHLTGPNADWLPPAREALLATEQYLAMLPVEPSTAERGLLGHLQFHGDRAARAALDAYYAERGWCPPRSDAFD